MIFATEFTFIYTLIYFVFNTKICCFISIIKRLLRTSISLEMFSKRQAHVFYSVAQYKQSCEPCTSMKFSAGDSNQTNLFPLAKEASRFGLLLLRTSQL